jgi:hypothetical protein
MNLGCNALEMAQSWQLDRIRILGAKSEPAEPSPGEEITFTSLVFTPQDQSLDSVIWFACLPEEANSFGCSIDPDLLEQLDNPPESPAEQLEFFQTLQEAGLAGVEPNFPPVWSAPLDALEGLSETQALEGVSAFVNITAIPSNPIDDEDVEVAYRRVPISVATNPNQNPTIIEMEVDGVPYDTGEVFIAKAGESYKITPVLSGESVEEYEYINPNGELEIRQEEPYCNWYLEGGSFDQDISLYPYIDAVWTAPPDEHEGVIVVVARDRRGGMNWKTLQVSVEK